MDTLIVENETAPRSAISWPGVLAGAAIATALSMAMLALGAGLGFSVTDPWSGKGALPTTTKAATVAGIYLTVTAVFTSAVGGYIAGRLRSLWPSVHHHKAFFRDTVHGVAAWAVSILVTAAFLGSVSALLAGGAVSGDKTSIFTPMSDEDRQSLAAMVAARTNIPQAAAEKRVVAAESEARAAAETARLVAMQVSFWFVAPIFAGALSAGLAGWEGGAVRDGRLQYIR